MWHNCENTTHPILSHCGWQVTVFYKINRNIHTWITEFTFHKVLQSVCFKLQLPEFPCGGSDQTRCEQTDSTLSNIKVTSQSLIDVWSSGNITRPVRQDNLMTSILTVIQYVMLFSGFNIIDTCIGLHCNWKINTCNSYVLYICHIIFSYTSLAQYRYMIISRGRLDKLSHHP